MNNISGLWRKVIWNGLILISMLTMLFCLECGTIPSVTDCLLPHKSQAMFDEDVAHELIIDQLVRFLVVEPVHPG